MFAGVYRVQATHEAIEAIEGVRGGTCASTTRLPAANLQRGARISSAVILPARVSLLRGLSPLCERYLIFITEVPDSP